MHKKIITMCLVLAFSFLMMPNSYAAETTYTIEEVHLDGSTTKLAEASSYKEALQRYEEHENQVSNLLIKDQDYIWKVKYGIALFDKSEACDVNVNYTSNGNSGYTNGCYGVDAAYLATGDNQNTIDFQLSGVRGSASPTKMELQPIEASTKTSLYTIKDKKLYHQIKTQMQNDNHSSSIYLGEAPSYLNDGSSYYSYDGHYFYEVQDDFTGFYQMIDDLRNNTHQHAVNATKPFYAYYQYVSHRSTTNYNESEINSYIDDTLHINKPLTSYISIGTSYHAILTQSLLKNQANAFLQYQNQFGANALMMMSLAMNESATGRSYLAFTRNNLFGHAAFDSAVEENASRYHTLSASIYSHAKHYINNSYLNPEEFQYHGGYFGNKASGMNVSYASDPYWGEKAAQYYYRIDDALGKKDIDQYAIAFANDGQNVKIYKDKNTESDVVYQSDAQADFAMIVLANDGEWLQIQSDPSQSETAYSFASDVAYVQKSDIAYIMNEDNIKKKTYLDITFDAVDGKFENGDTSITLAYPKDSLPTITSPQKTDWFFVGWDKEIVPATSSTQYRAQYAKIQDATLTTLPKQNYQSGEQLDVSDGVLTIILSNGAKQEIPLDTSMVSGFDTESTGTQTLEVNVQGITASYTIEISEDDSDTLEELYTRITSLLENFDKSSELSSTKRQEILTLEEDLSAQGTPDLSLNEYRRLDEIFQIAYDNALQIILQDDDLQAQISGLTIATDLGIPSFLPTVMKIDMQKDVDEEKQTQFENVAIGNGYSLDTTFSIQGTIGYQAFELQDDIIVGLKKTKSDTQSYDYLILQFVGNDIRIVNSSQTQNYITFTTDSFGDYAIVSRPSDRIYENADVLENNSMDTNGFDYFQMAVGIACLAVFLIVLLLTLIIRKKRGKKGRKKKQKRSKKQAIKKSKGINPSPKEEQAVKQEEVSDDGNHGSI